MKRTEQQNKELELILNFLGIDFIDYQNRRISNGHRTAKTIGEIKLFFGRNVMTSGQFIEDIDWWDFENNWNWLIIVIKKIRNIVNTELSINEFDKFRYLEQRLNPYNYEIDSVFNGCIEFIKWYNENNK